MLVVSKVHLFDDHRFYIVRFIVSLRNVMAKNAISIIGFNASNYLVMNVLHTLMILLLGRVEYGHFFLAAQIISVFSPILLLGRDSLMVKKIPHLIHQTRKDWLMSFIRDNLRFLCISICRRFSLMRVRINIVLKSSVLDPQGQAVATSLLGQGFDNIKNVRQGKILDIEFNSKEVDINMINEMCEGFLTNPIVEDYAIEEINT